MNTIKTELERRLMVRKTKSAEGALDVAVYELFELNEAHRKHIESWDIAEENDPAET